MLIGGTVAYLFLSSSGDEISTNFKNAFGIAFVWSAIFVIQMPFGLKEIEVDEKGIRVKSDSRDKTIPFKNVNSVVKFGLSNPMMVIVKYSTSDGNEKRKLSYMRNSKYQRIMKEDEMTEYLTNQAKANNPNFEESNTFKNLLILFLLGLPFFIGMFYFMTKT